MMEASQNTVRKLLSRWRGQARRTSGWAGLIYVMPALFILLAFQVWPPIFAFWISLWNWGIRPINLVGPGNYSRMFAEGFLTRDFQGHLAVGEVLSSLIVTVYYVLGTVPVSIGIAFVLAYLLFRQVGNRLQKILQPIYFLPVVVSSAALALVFQWIFDPRIGVANALLKALGIPEQQWLQDPSPFVQRVFEAIGLGWPRSFPDLFAGPSTAMVVIIIYTVWSTLGFNIVIYLAGMTTVSSELYDAARIDGAGRVALMRWITWPLLTPITLFLTIYNTIKAFQAFTPIYTLTHSSGAGGGGTAGGPLSTTQTMPVLIFNKFYVEVNGDVLNSL